MCIGSTGEEYNDTTCSLFNVRVQHKYDMNWFRWNLSGNISDDLLKFRPGNNQSNWYTQQQTIPRCTRENVWQKCRDGRGCLANRVSWMLQIRPERPTQKSPLLQIVLFARSCDSRKWPIAFGHFVQWQHSDHCAVHVVWKISPCHVVFCFVFSQNWVESSSCLAKRLVTREAIPKMIK